jgi:hypothetical protein
LGGTREGRTNDPEKTPVSIQELELFRSASLTR